MINNESLTEAIVQSDEAIYLYASAKIEKFDIEMEQATAFFATIIIGFLHQIMRGGVKK